MLLLRQLAASGLIMLLLPLWRRRHPLATLTGSAADAAAGASQAMQPPPEVDPAAVAAGAAALREAVRADPGAFAGALFQQLAHGHPLLGADGQQRSARCAVAAAGQQRARCMEEVDSGVLHPGALAIERVASLWQPAGQPAGPLFITLPPRPVCRPQLSCSAIRSSGTCRQMLGMSRDDMLIKMVAKTLTRWADAPVKLALR